jgi:trimethylamine:corrinoid methyltransferase-like protein
MLTQTQFLSKEEQHIIHNESIRILEEVGALFHSKRALGILSKSGAKVDMESGIAKFSSEMITEALKTAPKSFVCGARVAEKDFQLPSSFSGYVLDNGGIFTRDFKTGERRNATEQDHYEFPEFLMR